MTEQEWLASRHPAAMMYDKRCRSHRKRRLIVCACIRQVLPLLPDDNRFLAALETSEWFADGLATAEEMKAARCVAKKALDELTEQRPKSRVLYAVLSVLFSLTIKPPTALVGALEAANYAGVCSAGQCARVREIFGNPFHRVAIDPAWLRWHDGLIVHMAQTIYDERRFQDLPILADALEEAGCTDPEILGHCRGPGEHVRGCWVVDALLGKG